VDDAFAQLLQQNDRTPAFPSIRFCGYGNFNPAQKGIEARADKRGMTLVGMYGTSEIQGLFSRQAPTDPLSIRALGGGWPVSPLVRFRARNPDTGEIQPHGESGELEILAPTSRMIGYFGDPEATASSFTEDGYYRTGDLGYSSEDGRIFYLGRMGDVFRLGGFLVSAKEIEEVVQEYPGIRACQVVDTVVNGAPRAIAFVLQEPAASVRTEDVLAHCRGRLARYKVPSHVFVLEQFPVADGTNGAKVQKNRLREFAAASINSPSTGVFS
jgi:fatty-acyl-CoA synthase